MKKIAMFSAATLVALSSSAVFAKGMGDAESVPYAVVMRCQTLQQQFNEASAHPKNATDLAAAKSAASQGASLCRASKYEEGGNTLAKALRMIGESAN